MKEWEEIENVVKAVCKVSGYGLRQGRKGGIRNDRRRESEPSFLNDKKEWLCMCENNKKGACELSTFLGVMKNPKSLFTY